MNPPLRLEYKPFWAPKAGHTIQEYEDAIWPRAPRCGCFTSFRCAVADGASESSFSGPWARMLVRAYGHQHLDDHDQDVGRLARRWNQVVEARDLAWYAQEKLSRGAHAALIGLNIQCETGLADATPARSTWEAVAVGDACLFLVRGGSLAISFPLNEPADFTLSPLLIGTKPTPIVDYSTLVRQVSGTLESQDLLILATDALAAWFIQDSQAGNAPWTRRTPRDRQVVAPSG